MRNGIKILAVATFFCCLALPVWAQSTSRVFTDYMGQTLPELFAVYGPPDAMGTLEPPYLILEYAEQPLQGFSYDLFFTVLGMDVVAVEYRSIGNAQGYVRSFESNYVGMLGKSRAEVLAFYGLPDIHLMRPYGKIEEMAYYAVGFNGTELCLVHNLEAGVVNLTRYYYYRDFMGEDAIATIQALMADLAPFWDKAAWVEKELDFGETPNDGRYSLVRLGVTADYGISFMSLANPVENYLDMSVVFADRHAQDAVGKLQIEHLDAFVSDHWRDPDYTNSGNREKLAVFTKAAQKDE